MSHPYRSPPAAPVGAPRASWWRNAWRLANLNRRRRYHLTIAAGLRWLEALAVCSIFWAGLRSAWTFMSAWPEPSTAAGWALAFALSPVSWFLADTLLGYLRLRRVRRALRNGDIGRLLDGTAAEHALRGATVTATTFPAIAAYRELARAGDVAAFDAKDKRPVTVEYTLQAMDYAEAARTIVITPPDAAIKATVLVLTDEERRGLTTGLGELGPVK